jgi:hypothetical protein
MPVYQLSLDNLAAVMILSLAQTTPFLLTHQFLVFVVVVPVFLEGLSQLSLVLRPSHSVRILQLWWTLAELLL